MSAPKIPIPAHRRSQAEKVAADYEPIFKSMAATRLSLEATRLSIVATKKDLGIAPKLVGAKWDKGGRS